ncbi:MAG TPA: cell wall hydrolase [Allosphingosinicella sp.]|jgi:spore germination cell wall hydrolase CwlJ-like protein
MKTILSVAALAGLLILAAQAQGERHAAATESGPSSPATDMSGWTRPLGAAPADRAAAPLDQPAPDAAEPDVVDAHWMALTMWGEARGQGEEAMRAVGHVIANRRRSGLHGDFVTDTVSAAFQFSCWNPGDPNREAMANVLDLPEGSREHDLWRASRRIADEILAGRSADPTAGALFYHTTGVAPRWSRGIQPVRRIGTHLFFTRAATA